MTRVDSPAAGSSITITQIMKSTDKNYEKIILTGKHGMDVFLSSIFFLSSKDKHLMTNKEKTFAISISVVLKISRRLRSHQSSPRNQWEQAC